MTASAADTRTFRLVGLPAARPTHLQSAGPADTRFGRYWAIGIHVETGAPGVPVDSHRLTPDTAYVVVARVWNGSTTAPAVDLPVTVGYLEFGIATIRHDVGMTTVDLAVKGAAGCPAFARVPWRTPPAPGHYCLQVELIWDDDANPGHKLGSTTSMCSRSTRPTPRSSSRCATQRRRPEHCGWRPDRYRILDPLVCPPDASRQELEEHRQAMLARHRRSAWPILEGWQVAINPREIRLEAGETATITADITAPDEFRGREVINIHAYDGPTLLGGVTLYVEGSD